MKSIGYTCDACGEEEGVTHLEMEEDLTRPLLDLLRDYDLPRGWTVTDEGETFCPWCTEDRDRDLAEEMAAAAVQALAS